MNWSANRLLAALRGMVVAVGALCSTATVVGQSAGSGIAQGAPTVPASAMAAHCLRMVSPTAPAGVVQAPSEVVLRVAVSRTGAVFPLEMVSGNLALEDSASSAVRLWRYSPYVHDGRAMAVITEVRVEFTPGKAGGMITHPVGGSH